MIMDHVKFVNFQIKMEFDRLFSKLTLNMACFFFHLLVARQRILGCCNFVCDGRTTLGNIWSSRIFCNIKFVKDVFRELVSQSFFCCNVQFFSCKVWVFHVRQKSLKCEYECNRYCKQMIDNSLDTNKQESSQTLLTSSLAARTASIGDDDCLSSASPFVAWLGQLNMCSVSQMQFWVDWQRRENSDVFSNAIVTFNYTLIVYN